MADANVLPIAAVAPVKPQSPGNATKTQPAEQESQPSFAQVLKSRSSTQQNTPAPAAKPAAAQSGRPSDKTENAEQGASDRAESGILELVTNAMLKRSGKSETGADSKPESAGETTTEAALITSVAADPATTAAALAANAASLAGNKVANSQDEEGSVENEDILSRGKNKNGASSADIGADEKTDTQDRQTKLLDARSPQSNVSAQALQAEQIANKSASDKTPSFSNELNLAQSNAAGTASTAQQISTGQTQQASLPSHEISTPVAARGWTEELGQKVTWVATRDNGRAELVLTPAHMGRVEVSIHMNGDQASASFVAANALAREALQDAMPRLREVLAQAGIQLGQASVDAGSGGNQAQAENSAGRSAPSSYGNDSSTNTTSLPLPASSTSWSRGGNGMIDTFA